MSTSVEGCTPLDEELRGKWDDPQAADWKPFEEVYTDAIVDAIVNSPRSLQIIPGPSEIGAPCNRLLGYKLLGIPERQRVPNWKATVGTGTHLWLEDAFDRYNLRMAPLLDGQERFYIETRVNVGEVNGITIEGSCDLYDRITGTVVDHKGLALTTPIPTPDGWTTMGQIDWGDQVFGSDGAIYTVVAKSDIKRIGTYIVRFDDGSEVVCDSEHIWWTQATGESEPTAKSIDEVIRTITKWGQKNHRVPVAKPLELPVADLPIDPYVLGCWLGDGNTRDGRITKGEDLFDILEDDGWQLGSASKNHSPNCVTRTVVGLTSLLRQNGLLGNKHIPNIYLRAGRWQRLRLLQGLMDTDGSWNKPRRRAVFSSTDKALAESVTELLCTLGQKPHLAEMAAHGFGIDTTAYHVEWTPYDLEPFRLPRKSEQVTCISRVKAARAVRRMIIDVIPGPDVETACIAVDSPNRVYLCGEQMIPTHNTCGPTVLATRRRKGPGQQYRIQAHLYGRGWQRVGLPVTRVMIAFLPRNGELDDAFIWSEPYDEQVALDALQRLEGIDHAVKALGPAALELLPTDNHYCGTCPYLLYHSTDLTKGCPGDASAPINKPIDQSAPFGAITPQTEVLIP